MITTVQIHHDCGVHIPFFLGTTQGNVITNVQVDAVGNVLMGSNCISAPMSKPVGGKLSAPVKKLSISQRDVSGISPSEKEWFLSWS